MHCMPLALRSHARRSRPPSCRRPRAAALFSAPLPAVSASLFSIPNPKNVQRDCSPTCRWGDVKRGFRPSRLHGHHIDGGGWAMRLAGQGRCHRMPGQPAPRSNRDWEPWSIGVQPNPQLLWPCSFSRPGELRMRPCRPPAHGSVSAAPGHCRPSGRPRRPIWSWHSRHGPRQVACASGLDQGAEADAGLAPAITAPDTVDLAEAVQALAAAQAGGGRPSHDLHDTQVASSAMHDV